MPLYEHSMTAYDDPHKPTIVTSTGRGYILFADDEAILRELASGALARAGYEVLVAEDGDRAAKLVDTHGHEIRLAILDWTMPGKSGEELVAYVRARQPNLPIVVSSGDTEAAAHSLAPLSSALVPTNHAPLRQLSKPWRLRALLELIDTMIAPVVHEDSAD